MAQDAVVEADVEFKPAHAGAGDGTRASVEFVRGPDREVLLLTSGGDGRVALRSADGANVLKSVNVAGGAGGEVVVTAAAGGAMAAFASQQQHLLAAAGPQPTQLQLQLLLALPTVQAQVKGHIHAAG